MKTEELIKQLEKERDLFISRGQSCKEHDATIDFLKTGKSNIPDHTYDLLDAARYDLETLYYDYGV